MHMVSKIKPEYVNICTACWHQTSNHGEKSIICCSRRHMTCLPKPYFLFCVSTMSKESICGWFGWLFLLMACDQRLKVSVPNLYAQSHLPQASLSLSLKNTAAVSQINHMSQIWTNESPSSPFMSFCSYTIIFSLGRTLLVQG